MHNYTRLVTLALLFVLLLSAVDASKRKKADSTQDSAKKHSTNDESQEGVPTQTTTGYCNAAMSDEELVYVTLIRRFAIHHIYQRLQ